MWQNNGCLLLLALLLYTCDALEVSSSGSHHTVDHTVASPIENDSSPAQHDQQPPVSPPQRHDSTSWTAPERGVPLPESMDPEELYAIFKHVYEQYTETAFQSADWEILHDKDNITISMLRNETDKNCPYVKMELYIPATAQTCWDFLDVNFWDINMPKMDAFYEGTTLHGEYNVSSNNATIALCRKRLKRLFAFGKRDLVFLSINDVPQNGTLVSGSVSVITDDLPRQAGYTRAYQDSISFYKPVPRFEGDTNKTATFVTILYRLDLNDSGKGGSGGAIPMWFYVRNIGRIAAMAVERMRQAMIQEEQNSCPYVE